MPEKDPTTYSLITYAWVAGLAIWGGVVSYYRKVKAGISRRFNFAELIGEILTSALAGVMTFWLCEWGQVDPLLSAVLIALSGHMGPRAIFQMEQMMNKKFPGGSS